MEIYILTVENALETAEKTGYDLKELIRLLGLAESQDKSMYVRAGKDWLQYIFIDNEQLHKHPEVDAFMQDDDLWERAVQT